MGLGRLCGVPPYARNFNPPIPCGMGPCAALTRYQINAISIHPSRVGWDRSKRLAVTSGLYFNPPIPCGMGQRTRVQRSFRAVFQSTHPVWDGTCTAASMSAQPANFNPPIPCGMGRINGNAEVALDEFQSTHPVWDGTMGISHRSYFAEFQSTHPVWDGTSETRGDEMSVPISIHPSRVGWDSSRHLCWRHISISIHPSRVGWDAQLWRARRGRTDFNPPIPCGMGPGICRAACRRLQISIHPSRVGWDRRRSPRVMSKKSFQSTHPVWDGTKYLAVRGSGLGYFNPPIPCGMGPYFKSARNRRSDFNPPIPCGMGPAYHTAAITASQFQSTHPVWDGTLSPARSPTPRRYFNPPIPCGMGPAATSRPDAHISISIHPSRVGWDQATVPLPLPATIFQSTHPVWDGTTESIAVVLRGLISIHPSRVGWDQTHQ